jgi:hypothetical protein
MNKPRPSNDLAQAKIIGKYKKPVFFDRSLLSVDLDRGLAEPDSEAFFWVLRNEMR